MASTATPAVVDVPSVTSPSLAPPAKRARASPGERPASTTTQAVVQPAPPGVGPGLEFLYRFVKALFECTRFSPECSIIALVFINRVVAFTGVLLTERNWRSLLLTALILAQKIWDDRSLSNASIATICPIFTTAKLNQLEKVFLQLINYDVTITSALYTKYYFELRTLMEDASGGQAPHEFSLKPLTPREASHLEERSYSAAEAHHLRRTAERRRKTFM